MSAGKRVRATTASGPQRGEVVLATWAEVFPLSTEPAQRVRRLLGPTADDVETSIICGAYVKAINNCLPTGLRLRPNGSLVSLSREWANPKDELFAGVISTDLDAIVQQHRAAGADQ
jgi:hypothetical protein